MYTNKQRTLYDNQDVDPLFMYYNTLTRKFNFGLVRLGITSIYITSAMKPLLKRGNILKTGKSFNLDIKSYKLYNVKADVVEIAQEGE